MYRDWELVEVLATTAAEIDDPELNSQVDQLVPLVAAGRRGEAIELLSKMRASRDGMLATLLDDFVAVLSEQDSAG
jgi:hypothetical protein